MILSDAAILSAMESGSIQIKPFYPHCLGCNSYDVHLSPHMAMYTSPSIDAAIDNAVETFTIPPEGFELMPGTLYLASTAEYTETHGFVPFLEGKSSGGRLGLSIHSTAGRGDSGFVGAWTLELSVVQPLIVHRYMPIGQLIFHTIQGEVLVPYNKKPSAHYNGKSLPVASKMYDGIAKDPMVADYRAGLL